MKKKFTFANRLSELRTKRGWTQAHLAQLTELDQSYVSCLEMGVRTPSFATQRALAKAFNMKIERLLEGVE